jgi:hypothetical protein
VSSDQPIELHLRVLVKNGRRADFFAFLREAIPCYTAPGGIRIRLLADRLDPQRFIEVVEYLDEATYQQDQARVAHDPTMQTLLARWREHLAEPPIIETYGVTQP